MRTLILCLQQEVYGKRLGAFIRQHYQGEFLVESRVAGKAFTLESQELLLTDQKELYSKNQKEGVYFLDFEERGEGLSPYCPADEIVSFLLWNIPEGKKHTGDCQTKMVVFYTPGGSSCQRRAALQKAESEAEYGECLYVPVRDFEGQNKDGEIPYDLSELCYQVRRGNKLRTEQVHAAVEHASVYGRLRGFHSPLHLVGLSDEIGRVIKFIIRECGYKTIVLDLQFLPPDYKDIFTFADEIYGVGDVAGDEQQNPVLWQGIEFLEAEKVVPQGQYRIWKWE